MAADDVLVAPSAMSSESRRAVMLSFVDRHPLVVVFAVALVVRAITALVVFVVWGGTLFPDDVTYSDMATAVVRGQTGSWDDFTRHLYDAASSFTLPLTLIYSVFGPIRLTGQLLSAVAGSLAAACAVKVAGSILAPRRAMIAGAIVALLPSQVLFSSLMLKDASVWLAGSATAVVVIAFLRATGRTRVVASLGVLAGLVVMAHLRAHTMVILCWALAIACLIGLWTKRTSVSTVALAIVTAVLLPYALGAGLGGATLVSTAGHLANLRLGGALGAATAFIETERDVAPDDVEDATQVAESAIAQQTAAVAQASHLQTEIDGHAAAADGQRRELEMLGAVLAASRAAVAADPGDDAAQRELAAVQEAYDAAIASFEARLEDMAKLEAEQHAAEAEAAEAARRAEEAAHRAAELTAELSEPFYPSTEDVTANFAHLPKGLLVIVVEPMPWRVFDSNRSVRLATADLVLWYPLVALGALGLFTAVRRRFDLLAFPVLVGGGSLLMYALAEGNFGTAFRHRGEFVWALAVLGAIGASELLDRRQRRAAPSSPS